MKYKTKLMSIIILVVMTAASLTGCAKVDAVSEVYGRPEVKECQLYDRGSYIDCKVVLKKDSSVDGNDLAKEIAPVVKNGFSNKDIVIKVVKDDKEIGSYTLK